MSAHDDPIAMSKSTLVVTDKVLSTFSPTKAFNYHKGASITSLDFDDSGQYLISSGIDKSIQLYDVHKGIHYKDIQSQKYGAHLSKFTHKDLNCLYVSTPSTEDEIQDHSIRYLSLSDKKYIRYFKGHSQQVMSLEVNPVHDTFISSSIDRTVKIWDFRVASYMGNIHIGTSGLVAYDPHGILFVVGKSNTTLEFYDLKSYEQSPFLTITLPTKGKWNRIQFSNNGKLILISTNTNEQYIVDAFLGQLLATLTGSYPDIITNYPNYGSACFSPCGRFVFAGSSNHTILLFDLSSVKSSNGTNSLIEAPINLSPSKTLKSHHVTRILEFNHKLLTLASADNIVSLWQPNSI